MTSLELVGGQCKVHRHPCRVALLYDTDREDIPRIVPGTRRRPYFGHIQHMGRVWVASTPGGVAVRSFATQREAKAWLAEKESWA